MVRKWEDLPDYMRVPEVKPYYDALKKKRFSLLCKRAFDIGDGRSHPHEGGNVLAALHMTDSVVQRQREHDVKAGDKSGFGADPGEEEAGVFPDVLRRHSGIQTHFTSPPFLSMESVSEIIW